jgi:hypothetical protein
MGMRLVPLCGGVPPSRGRRGFLSSGIESFHARWKAAEKVRKSGAGLAWAMPLFYLFKEGFSKAKTGK